MAVGIVDRQKLVNIADAVREKKGITGNMTLDAIASNISSIPTADNNAKFDFSKSGSKSSGDLRSYLTTVDLSNFDTSNYTSMENMFQLHSALKNIDVSGFNTSKVTSMGTMFYSCASLTTLDLSSFNTTNVTNMTNMFDNCSSLRSLDVSSFNTSKVGGYGGFKEMFSSCKSLETLDISNFDFSNVKEGSYYGLNGLFKNCTKLSTIYLPQTVTFKNSGISLNNMFSSCSSLTSLDLSNFDTSNVQYMESMFSSCSSLTSLDLSNFDTSKVSEMKHMFQNCSKLSNLTLGNDWASNSSIKSFDLSYCPLSHESAVDVINKLATRSNSPVIKFSGKVGLYQSEIDVATNKGWSVSGCRVLVDAESANVEQYTLIDGVISKCVYVADAPQAWGQRVFSGQMLYVGDTYMHQWGGNGTATGITATDIGTGLTNTNALIAMNLQSTNGKPTIWDVLKEFRSTYGDRWFIPSRDEAVEQKRQGADDVWTSSEYDANQAYITFDYNSKSTYVSKTSGYRAYAFTYV